MRFLKITFGLSRSVRSPMWDPICPLALSMLFLGLFSAAIVNGDTVFSDTQFPTANWSTVVAIDTSGTLVHNETQSLTGGNPNAYRDATFSTNGIAGSNTAAVYNFQTGAQYNPSSQGAIQSIDFAIDGNLFSAGDAGAMDLRLGIRQNGILYIPVAGSTVVLVGTGWQHFSVAGLTQSAFTNFPGNGLLHPDFSATGGAIDFGFDYDMSQNTGNPISGHAGADNWSVDIHSVPEPTAYLGWALLGLLTRVRRRR